ncbi:MAG TPA: EamA family transporter [Vicinamibacterales bacterium]
MSSLAIICWLLNVCVDTAGHLSFKAAAVVADEIHGIARWRAMLRDKWIWLGLLAFVFEFAVWVAFLSLVPLSIGVLLASANLIAIMIGGRIFFAEQLTPKRIAAAALITVGVALVGIGTR